MSSHLATGIALLLHMIPLSAIALAAWRPRFLIPAGAAISVAVVGVSLMQTGIMQSGTLASTNVAHLFPVHPFSNRCQQMFDMLIEARIVSARPSTDGLVVDGELWSRLPTNAQDAILVCSRELIGSAAGTEDIKVILR